MAAVWNIEVILNKCNTEFGHPLSNELFKKWKYRVFLLLPYQAQQLYHIESMHLLEHRATAAVLRRVINETHCTKVLLLLLLIILITIAATTTTIHNVWICTVARNREFCCGFCWYNYREVLVFVSSAQKHLFIHLLYILFTKEKVICNGVICTDIHCGFYDHLKSWIGNTRVIQKVKIQKQ
jgi:hypothetical protein